MRSKLALCAALFAMLTIDVYAPPADACGVKLAIKNSRPRKSAARSTRPSHLLLVGSPPARLQHDLSAAGHDVEVVGTATDAKRPSYAVVVVASNEQATEAHSRFPDAMVVVRSGDVTADINSVENQVARRLVRAGDSRPVIAAGPTRTVVGASDKDQPIAARGTTGPVDAKAGGPEPVPTTGQPRPTPVPKETVKETAKETPKETPKEIAKETPKETVKTPAEEPKVAAAEPKPTPVPTKAPKAEPKKVKSGKAVAAAEVSSGHEVYFMLGSASIDATRVDAVAQWLGENGDAKAIIEGHADPTGNHAANMALSKARAEAVRDALVAGGVDGARLEVKAFGDTKMKYGKADPRNRRVAVVRAK